MATLDDTRAYSAYALARLAECGSPDSPDSAGATFLTSVRDTFVNMVENDAITPGQDDRDGVITEIAGDAADPYTHPRWLEFIDLTAYREYPTGLEDDDADRKDPNYLFDLTGQCLQVIAERLCYALLAELPPVDDDTEESE